MMKKQHFLALQQLSTILSKALADCSGVFGELAEYPDEPAAPQLWAVGEPAPAAKTSVFATEAPPAAPPEPLPIAAVAPVQVTPAGPDIVHIDDACKTKNVSPSTLYALIKRGLCTAHRPYGRMVFVSLSEIDALVKQGHLRIAPPARRGMMTLLQAAAFADINSQVLYKLVAENRIVGATKNGRRIEIPQSALEDYMRANGMLPPAAAPVEPEAPAVEEGPSLQERLEMLLGGLEEELHQLEQYLPTMDPVMRASQIAMWAGSMRKAAHELQEVPPEPRVSLKARVHDFTDHLRRHAEHYKVFVNALIVEWEIESWDLYIRSVSTAAQTFIKEEEDVIAIGNLRAMMMRPKLVEPEFAKKVIDAARAVLPENNIILIKASRMFESKLLSLVPPPPPEPEEIVDPEESGVSPAALALTRGKRMLIVGGQGERSAHQESYMQHLKLESCEWVTHERNKVIRHNKGINLRNYDLMLYLNAYTSHATGALVTLAQKNKVPVVKITRGYSVSSIAHAIEEQYSEPVIAPAVAAPARGGKKTPTRRPADRRAHA